MRLWVASDWYSLGAIASLPLDILLSNFLKMYMMKSTKFNINIALSPSKRQCGLANWGCRGRIGGGHHYDVKSTLLDSACLRVSIQTKIFCLEWNLRLLGHRDWKWRPPVYSMTMVSSDLKFSWTMANTKAQHLGLNTCHWKKKFPKKKDLENVPYNQCPLSDLSPLVWKEWNKINNWLQTVIGIIGNSRYRMIF